MMRLKDNKDCLPSIFGIEEYFGKKYIHIYGYGYCVDDGYRFLEYTGYYIDVQDITDKGFYTMETENCDCIKTYIIDCDWDELNEIYDHYDDGNCPKTLSEFEITTVKLGVYVLSE